MNPFKPGAASMGLWALALAVVFATDAGAQTSAGAKESAEDMRLWSFGDCDRRFPYFNAEDHKECVRVVGSPEAKDARALRLCTVSHAQDPAEIERCKSVYLANKQKAIQDGAVAGTAAASQAPLSAEVIRSVRAIASDAVERDRAAAPSPAPPPAPEAEPEAPPAEESSLMRTLGSVCGGLLVLCVAAVIMRRRQAASA